MEYQEAMIVIRKLEQKLKKAENVIERISKKDKILVYGEWCDEYLTKYKKKSE